MRKNKALDHKCPACMAPIHFNPTLEKWKCEYCESEFTLEELQKFNNASSEKNNEGGKGDDTAYDSYRCSDCGAEIIADENTAATFCLYCGNTAILKNKLSGKFAPTKVIPFKKVKEDAVLAFKGLQKGRPLLPKDFVSIKNIEKITGLYIPFWLFDVNADGDVEAIGKRITNWRVGDTHYTKTDTYNLVRSGSMKYHLIPVDGSKRFDDAIMNTIEPFNYNELVTYNHAYLSGFLAEKYDFESKDAFEIAKKRALQSTMDEVKKTMNRYTGVVVKKNNLDIKEEKCDYALLPVWMVNVKYNGKYYLFAMNGQTGEFIGDMPISKGKVLAYSIAIFIICMLLFIGISYLIYIGGAA